MGLKGQGRRDFGARECSPPRIKAAIKSTQSMGQAALYLGVSKNTFKKYAKQYGVWSPRKSSKGIRKSAGGHLSHDIQKILQGENPNPYRENTLLDKAIREGYIPCQCNNCKQDFSHVKQKEPPLILDFLDRNTQNTKVENLRALCFNCIYELSYSKKGWYRHRETPIGMALDEAVPIKPEDLIKSKHYRVKDTAQDSPESVTTETRAIPEETEIEYIPFEEFQKML